MRKQPHFLRRFAVTAAVALALCAGVSAQAASLVPLGRAVGIQMTTAGMLVADLAEVDTPGGKATPAKDAGLLPGDVICRIDGRDIASSADFLAAVDAAGDTMSVTVLRGGAEVTATVTPAVTELPETLMNGETSTLPAPPAVTADGTRQLGLWLRDGVTGVGTLTYYDPATGRYGALGHGISDETSGVLMPLRDGSVLSAVIADARPGGHGTAGELVGSFDPGDRIGGIERNCLFGIFGTLDAPPAGDAVETASADTVKTGGATILSTVAGEDVRAYTVDISRVYHDGGCTRFLITVTDPDLLAATGGIVQGMSGSPILQDGRLIGAVTHVLLADPAKGYGVSIDDMLAASAAQDKAA